VEGVGWWDRAQKLIQGVTVPLRTLQNEQSRKPVLGSHDNDELGIVCTLVESLLCISEGITALPDTLFLVDKAQMAADRGEALCICLKLSVPVHQGPDTVSQDRRTPGPLVDIGSPPVEEAACVLMESSRGGSPGGAGGVGAPQSSSSSSSIASSARVFAAAPDGDEAASKPSLRGTHNSCGGSDSSSGVHSTARAGALALFLPSMPAGRCRSLKGTLSSCRC